MTETNAQESTTRGGTWHRLERIVRDAVRTEFAPFWHRLVQHRPDDFAKLSDPYTEQRIVAGIVEGRHTCTWLGLEPRDFTAPLLGEVARTALVWEDQEFAHAGFPRIPRSLPHFLRVLDLPTSADDQLRQMLGYDADLFPHAVLLPSYAAELAARLRGLAARRRIALSLRDTADRAATPDEYPLQRIRLDAEDVVEQIEALRAREALILEWRKAHPEVTS